MLQVVDKGPAQSSSFAVESLVRTFDLELADAFVDEVIGKELLGDGALLEIFGELGVGEDNGAGGLFNLCLFSTT